MTASISPAREVAFDAFVMVMEQKKTPEEALDSLYAKKDLKRLDRNFVKEALWGSLRWYSKIYWILQNTSNRNLDDSSPQIRAALVIGTYQIFYMDRVPERAAVNESAEYVRMRGQASAVSFVNGILRKIARRAEYFTKPDKKKQPAEYLALQFSHPQWMVRRWTQHFRFEKMEEMLASNNQPPPWTVRINSMKTPVTESASLMQLLLKEERCHADRRPLRSALWLKQAPNFEPESLFQRGYYTVQDEASQLIAHLVAPKADEEIVDATSGPGGKLSHMYEISEGKARFTAIEKHPAQMIRAKETMTRLGHDQVTWVDGDFLDFKPKNPPVKILLDAPCSGFGVLRRHPEGKWQKEGGVIPTMAALQRQLITHALKILAPGGELIYSVCSFEPEESADHLAWIREQYGDRIDLISPVARLPDYYKRYVTRENLLLVFAGNQDEMDGFGAFIVKVKGP